MEKAYDKEMDKRYEQDFKQEAGTSYPATIRVICYGITAIKASTSFCISKLSGWFFLTALTTAIPPAALIATLQVAFGARFTKVVQTSLRRAVLSGCFFMTWIMAWRSVVGIRGYIFKELQCLVRIAIWNSVTFRLQLWSRLGWVMWVLLGRRIEREKMRGAKWLFEYG